MFFWTQTVASARRGRATRGLLGVLGWRRPAASLAIRAKRGAWPSSLLSQQTREEARCPAVAGNQGSELTGADVLAADEPEGCEIGEERGSEPPAVRPAMPVGAVVTDGAGDTTAAPPGRVATHGRSRARDSSLRPSRRCFVSSKRGGLVCGRRGGCSAYEAGGCAGRPARAAAMVGSDATRIRRMRLDQISGVHNGRDLPTDWDNMYLRGDLATAPQANR